MAPREQNLKTLLVVDDEREFCEMLTKFLHARGYHAVCASNGWEALIALDSHSIDAILLDVLMPGMDGVTFLKILQRASQDRMLPVLVVSVLPEQEVSDRMRGLPVRAFVSKGHLDELGEMVERMVGPGEPIHPDFKD